MRRIFAASATVAALLLAGCETSDARNETSDATTLAKRPAAYRPDQFPDIPFERLVGYRLTAEDQQIAVAYAGGTLRRLSLVFITKEGDEAKVPQQELDRIVGGLTGVGWRKTAADVGTGEAVFAKGHEVLTVTASPAGSATTIAFRLSDTKH